MCVFVEKKRCPSTNSLADDMNDVMNDASMFSLFIVKSFKVGHGWFTTGCAT